MQGTHPCKFGCYCGPRGLNWVPRQGVCYVRRDERDQSVADRAAGVAADPTPRRLLTPELALSTRYGSVPPWVVPAISV
jgi:hypothetical protein